jgi:tetratricopeptide (TPR) repeat protein
VINGKRIEPVKIKKGGNMKNFSHTIRLAAFSIWLALPNISAADAVTASRLALEAKQALDEHFGNQAQLALAAKLLARAIEENRDDASIYVQAARLTVKGGHVVATQFRPGTVDAYGELLDRALSLGPGNAKAHILKAEYFHLKGAFPSERAELGKARQTGTNDAWLLVGYGRLYESTGEVDQALRSYSAVRARGPGASLEQRNAYIAALNGLAAFAAMYGDDDKLRELMVAIRKGRDPRDAWALGNLADSLVHGGMFDEAIAVAREALQTMNYGAGRLGLTAALYGKAAELTLAKKPGLAAPLIKEARDFGYGKASVLGRFKFSTAKVTRLLPTLETIVE